MSLHRVVIPSELPTMQDILIYGLLMREQSGEDVSNYPVVSLIKDIYPEVLEKWERANSSLVAPVIN